MMQNTLPEEQVQTKGRRHSRLRLTTGNLILAGVYGVIILIAVNAPWTRQFVVNVVNGNPLVEVGYWVSGALFTLILTWRLLTDASMKLVGRIGLQAVFALGWTAWITWLTNDRMNEAGAFADIGVVFNAIGMCLFVFLLALPIVWYDHVRQFFKEKSRRFRRS